jgi:mannose/fructose/N-acetylgalactosamine-specific phosphotransferase system component IIC
MVNTLAAYYLLYVGAAAAVGIVSAVAIFLLSRKRKRSATSPTQAKGKVFGAT